MGSEFSYEDLSSREMEKYTHIWLRDEPCPGKEWNGLECFVLESRPNDRRSGYTRIVEWFDKKEYRNIKSKFYDRKKSHLKTLTLGGHKNFLSRCWGPMTMEMINHQSGKSTTLTWIEYTFKTGLKKSDFNKNALKRAK